MLPTGTEPAVGGISIGDVTVAEGNSGTTVTGSGTRTAEAYDRDLHGNPDRRHRGLLR